MPVVASYASSINIAKYYQSKELWVAFGGSSITWPDEENPPQPSPTINSISDLRGLLYIDIKRLVIKNIGGSIKTEKNNYIYIDSNSLMADLISSEAFYLYLEATLPVDSVLTNETFRLLGVAENVVTSNTTPRSKGLFIPAVEVTNYDLVLVNTIKPLTLLNTERKFQFVRRF